MTKPYRAIPIEEIVAAWPSERREKVAQRVREMKAEDEAAESAEDETAQPTRLRVGAAKTAAPAR